MRTSHPEQQRLFRRLALHPGTDIDRYAAAALDGTGLAAARRGLEGLYEQYLLTEPAPGRYRMHDLIREHARALASRLDPGDDREQATGRLLDYYQHAAARAQALLARQTRGVPAPAAGAAPADVPVLASREQALAWARAERTSLLACLDQATAAGQHARVIALTAALEGLLRHDGPWDEAITRHATAVQAARQLGDRPGEALALSNLGDVRQLAGDYPGAARDLQEALGICRDLGDRPGQALALTSLGNTQRHEPRTTRARPGTCRRRWASAGTSATGPARPTPSTTSGSRDCRPGSLRARPGTCRRRWASAGTSATGPARLASSSAWGRHSG